MRARTLRSFLMSSLGAYMKAVKGKCTFRKIIIGIYGSDNFSFMEI